MVKDVTFGGKVFRPLCGTAVRASARGDLMLPSARSLLVPDSGAPAMNFAIAAKVGVSTRWVGGQCGLLPEVINLKSSVISLGLAIGETFGMMPIIGAPGDMVGSLRTALETITGDVVGTLVTICGDASALGTKLGLFAIIAGVAGDLGIKTGDPGAPGMQDIDPDMLVKVSLLDVTGVTLATSAGDAGECATPTRQLPPWFRMPPLLATPTRMLLPLVAAPGVATGAGTRRLPD